MTKCNQRLINPHCYQGSSLPMHCFLLNKYLSADHTCCVTLLGIQATCSKLAEVNGKSLLSPPDHWLQNELEPSVSNQQPSPCYASSLHLHGAGTEEEKHWESCTRPDPKARGLNRTHVGAVAVGCLPFCPVASWAARHPSAPETERWSFRQSAPACQLKYKA